MHVRWADFEREKSRSTCALLLQPAFRQRNRGISEMRGISIPASPLRAERSEDGQAGLIKHISIEIGSFFFNQLDDRQKVFEAALWPGVV
jgi:hypothetical protein